MSVSREEREKGMGKVRTVGDDDRKPTKAIPGFTGYLRNTKDHYGISSGKMLEMDAGGISPVKIKRPTKKAAGSTFVSALDTDGAVWDHEYMTTSRYMDRLAGEGLNKASTSVVGYTGHVHLGQEIIGACHDEVVRMARHTHKMMQETSPTKEIAGESKPNWTSFATRSRGERSAWKQDYVTTLTTRPNNKKVEPTADFLAEQEALRQQKLEAKAKLAHKVIPDMPPPVAAGAMVTTLAKMNASPGSSPWTEPEDKPLYMGPTPLFLRDNTLMTEAPEEERSYTGHFSTSLAPKQIVGYTGHLHGGHDLLGLNYGRAQRQCNPYAKVPEEAHPLGCRYQSAPPRGPPISGPIKSLVQRPSRPKESGNQAVDTVRIRVVQRSGRLGFRKLTQILRRMGSDRGFSLSRYEFQSALNTFGIHPSKLELDQLMVIFDKMGDEVVNVIEVVDTFRGALSQKRITLLQMAYNNIVEACGGEPTFRQLTELHDAFHHPEVYAGEKTAYEVSTEFAKTWPCTNDPSQDTPISPEEFVDYYADISAAIDNDQYFELMIRNVWHVSGGEGPATNTSCRRVAVAYEDGNQGVVEVENDLGINQNDKAALFSRLREKQGLKNIVQIFL